MTEQNNNSNINSSDSDEISVKELFFSIHKLIDFIITKWKFIVIFVCIGTLIGFYYSKSQKILYNAELIFVLEEEKGGSNPGLGNLANQFGFDFGSSGAGGAFAGANLLELMKSRLMIEKTLLSPIELNGKITNLAEYYIDLNHLRSNWARDKSLVNITYSPSNERSNFSLKHDSILYKIYKEVSSTDYLLISQKDKKVSFTSVMFSYTDEMFAKLFCENLVKKTSDYYIEIKSRKAKLNVEILQKQVDSVRAEFNISVNSVAAATDNIYNLNPAYKAKGTMPTQKQLNLQINSNLLTSLISNLEMSKMTLRKETPLVQIIDGPILPLKKEKISTIFSLLLGGGIFGIISILFLFISKFYKNIIK